MNEIYSPVRLYSYGQPRTGNTVYAGYVDSLFPNNAFRGEANCRLYYFLIPTIYRSPSCPPER